MNQDLFIACSIFIIIIMAFVIFITFIELKYIKQDMRKMKDDLLNIKYDQMRDIERRVTSLEYKDKYRKEKK